MGDSLREGPSDRVSEMKPSSPLDKYAESACSSSLLSMSMSLMSSLPLSREVSISISSNSNVRRGRLMYSLFCLLTRVGLFCSEDIRRSVDDGSGAKLIFAESLNDVEPEVPTLCDVLDVLSQHSSSSSSSRIVDRFGLIERETLVDACRLSSNENLM